mmetsp:Transcript_1215/g.2769  ORF Transcript_1215/g.2769 Transcript_1215/m.2769 type:complete len:263 (+) Transcript_1215:997-1785(+)
MSGVLANNGERFGKLARATVVAYSALQVRKRVECYLVMVVPQQRRGRSREAEPFPLLKHDACPTQVFARNTKRLLAAVRRAYVHGQARNFLQLERCERRLAARIARRAHHGAFRGVPRSARPTVLVGDLVEDGHQGVRRQAVRGVALQCARPKAAQRHVLEKVRLRKSRLPPTRLGKQGAAVAVPRGEAQHGVQRRGCRAVQIVLDGKRDVVRNDFGRRNRQIEMRCVARRLHVGHAEVGEFGHVRKRRVGRRAIDGGEQDV